MFWIDLFITLADFVEEIWFGKKYGFGSFLWGCVSSVCFIFTVMFFYFDLNVLGAIGILGFIVCSGCSIYRAVRDIRKKSIDQVAKETK